MVRGRWEENIHFSSKGKDEKAKKFVELLLHNETPYIRIKWRRWLCNRWSKNFGRYTVLHWTNSEIKSSNGNASWCMRVRLPGLNVQQHQRKKVKSRKIKRTLKLVRSGERTKSDHHDYTSVQVSIIGHLQLGITNEEPLFFCSPSSHMFFFFFSTAQPLKWSALLGPKSKFAWS